MWDDMINTVTSVGGLVAVGVGAAVAGGAAWYFSHISEEEQQKHDADVAATAARYAFNKARQDANATLDATVLAAVKAALDAQEAAKK